MRKKISSGRLAARPGGGHPWRAGGAQGRIPGWRDRRRQAPVIRAVSEAGDRPRRSTEADAFLPVAVLSGPVPVGTIQQEHVLADAAALAAAIPQQVGDVGDAFQLVGQLRIVLFGGALVPEDIVRPLALSLFRVLARGV